MKGFIAGLLTSIFLFCSPADAKDMDEPVKLERRVDFGGNDERVSDERASYDLGLGIGNWGALEERRNPKEINRAKITLDYSICLCIDKLGTHESLGERLTLFGILTAEMIASSYFIHEEAGHGATYEHSPKLFDNRRYTKSYNGFIDQHACGINNSELLFNEYFQHAQFEGMNLADAVGMVLAKLDPIIQWSYSQITDAADPHINRYEQVKQRIRSGAETMDSHADIFAINSTGKGDNERYVKLRSLIKDTSMEDDLWACLINLSSPQFWQSIFFASEYLSYGKLSTDLWGLEFGENKIYLPAVSVYRLPSGYWGDAKIYARLGDFHVSLEAGTGLRFLGSEEDRVMLGGGIHYHGKPISGSFSLRGGKDFWQARAKIGYEVREGVRVYAAGVVEDNWILRREYFPEKDMFISFGVDIHL